ncbi:MAG: transcription-repair coupling factor [Candidatus Abawacabacteria bacterium]|nr:transcription-repair coupling factor [Candidatus Abawacabacteria bacterium]
MSLPVCALTTLPAKEYAAELSSGKVLHFTGAASSASKILTMFHISTLLDRAVLWLADDPAMLERLASDGVLWEVPHFFFLGSDTLLGNHHLQVMRLVALIHQGKKPFVVTTPEVFADLKLPTPYDIEQAKISLRKGKKIHFVQFFNKLIDSGYQLASGLIVDQGFYVKRGGIIDIFPVNRETPLRIELFDDEVESIMSFNPATQEKGDVYDSIDIFPVDTRGYNAFLKDYLTQSVVVLDELSLTPAIPANSAVVNFLPFAEDISKKTGSKDLHCTSVLRFHNPLEFTTNLKQKVKEAWQIVIFTSDAEKIWQLLVDQGFSDSDIKRIRLVEKKLNKSAVDSFSSQSLQFPEAFQNSLTKLLVITDQEIFGQFQKPKKYTQSQVDAAFLASLNPGDLVVHIDHGLALFQGTIQKTVDNTTREYLQLDYAKGDKLFVPVEQADKVNKYIGATGEHAPPLTRLGSGDWNRVTSEARKESLVIAKELLELYALRETAKGFAHSNDEAKMSAFDASFGYVETPGQLKAIEEIKRDMEKERPMDRLLCGDVGFGKTEIAMRAAFKAFLSGKQVAILAPITILADQHCRSFTKRMDPFGVRVAMISRFNGPAEQKKTLEKLKKGEVDIIIGTHRLFQEDVKFKDLGLVVIDEEQRFGVKQKEKLKALRHSVDILTLTATPIPRTLNMSLSGLRDISTITTPPPGRLPVVTEVRRFSMSFIREAILRELERKGQVYFLHNRVQTIESMKEKLQNLVPEARFIVAHGQLSNEDLENRILSFKDHKYDVLISSTIIENGIDLPNANTLIVDNAERLGLAQAYQLRGRVGRSKTQAYAYFLYHSQKLDDTAKKRLRAIVEASELGSGFQIAMRDLEIRGAGDILGAKQHGSINAIGVTHFTRLLKQAVENLKSGKSQIDFINKPKEEALIELPVTAYIPDTYIDDHIDKIKYYQQLASCDTLDNLTELTKELAEKYGELPTETRNLLKVLELKIHATKANLIAIKETYIERQKRIELVLGARVTPREIMKLLAQNPRWMISGQVLKIKKDELGIDWFSRLCDDIRAFAAAFDDALVIVKK